MADFIRIEVRVEAGRSAEIAAAEAFSCGAVGLEEREGPGEPWVTLLLYAPAGRATEIREGLARCGIADERVVCQKPVPEVDWVEQWKAGLEATVVSPRLLVRPSFVASPGRAGQAEIVIDPGQAFGTGGHASTLLALQWIDAVADRLPAHARVLDVGTGTGVLALCAAKVQGTRAVAFDVDCQASRAALENARINGLEDRVLLFTGTLAALHARPFDLVVANLLRSELLPLLAAIARATRPGGMAIFSGLLAQECEQVERALESAGLPCVARRHHTEPSGLRWAGLLSHRRPARSSDRTGG